jgi:alpha-tubulin suppressor-like RCC1 family protein
VRCWGSNSGGELGDGSRELRTTPTPVAGLRDVVEVSAGLFHTCARRANGEVLCWGDGDHGEIGPESPGDEMVADPWNPHGPRTRRIRTRPAAVPGLPAVEQLSLADYYTCARVRGAAPWCWGRNDVGELGDGSRISRAAPAPVHW